MANVEDGSVSVNDTQPLAEAARIPVGAAPVQVGFTPDGGHVYVPLRDEKRVSIIGAARREVLKTVSVGDRPNGVVYGP